MKQILRFKSFLILALLAMVGTNSVWAQSTASYTAADADKPTAKNGTVTGSVTGTNSISWSYSVTQETKSSKIPYVAYKETSGWQLGSSNSPCTAFSISTSGISGTITKVEVVTGSKSASSKINVTVGGNAFGTQEQETGSGETVKSLTFAGSASGEIIVSATASSAAFYFKSVTVTYTAAGDDTPDTRTDYAGTFTLSDEEVSVEKGGTKTVNVTTDYDGTLAVASSDEAKATATIAGKVITVTGVAAGTATITVSGTGSDNYKDITWSDKTIAVTVTKPEGDATLWEEDWSSFKNGDVPTANSDETITYTLSNTDSKIYAANLAGGTSPELLVKQNSTFSAAIPLQGYYGELTLSFKRNNNTLTPSVGTGEGTVVLVSGSGADTYVYSIKSVPEGTATLHLTFTAGSSNVRLDDIVLTGSTKSTSTRVAAGFSFSATTATAKLGAENELPTFSNPNNVSVTFTSSDPTVATIDANTGAVTLVGAGTTTISATSELTDDYLAGNASYTLTVVDPNVRGAEGNPYTVAEAIAAIDAADKGTINNVYVKGIVSQVDSYNEKYKSITYRISDDGTTTGQFEVYSGKGLNGADFSAVTDVQVGDEVVVKGNITYYSRYSVYEFEKDNQLVSHKTKADPELAFSAETATGVLGETFTAPTLTNPHELSVTYASSDESVATIDATGNVTILAKGTTNITASFAGNETYRAATATYTLKVKTPNFIDLRGKSEAIVLENATLIENLSGNSYSSGELTVGDYTFNFTDCSKQTYVQLKAESGVFGSPAVKSDYGYTLTVVTATGTNAEGVMTVQIGEETAQTATGADQTIICTTSSTSSAFVIKNTSKKIVKIASITLTPKAAPKTNVDVTIGETGYATLYYGDRNLVVPEGVEAITYKMADEKLTESWTYSKEAAEDLEETSAGIIPAGTAVVLKGTANTAYTFTVTEEEGLDDSTNNILKGSDVEAMTTGGTYYYALSLNAESDLSSVGFYWVTDGGAAFNCPAHKAYLALDEKFSKNGAVRSFLLNDVQTGIATTFSGSPAEGRVYDLQGRRVGQPASGLYIVNGKKVFVK